MPVQDNTLLQSQSEIEKFYLQGGAGKSTHCGEAAIFTLMGH